MWKKFQSSFELTGYITMLSMITEQLILWFQSSFELTGYITCSVLVCIHHRRGVSKLFRAYVLYNYEGIEGYGNLSDAFQSSFELTGYITGFQLMIL